MTTAQPQPDPCQGKSERKTVSVAFPFELYRELQHRARLSGESVASYAARLLSEAIRELPPGES